MRLGMLILIYPVAELVTLILAGSLAGFWPVVIWLLAAGLAGGWLVKSGGRQAAAGLQSALRGDPGPAQAAAGGAITVLAGVLLLLPGLLGDLAAVALLLPPVHRMVARRLGLRAGSTEFVGMVWQSGPAGHGSGPRRARNDESTIDGQYEVIAEAGASGPGAPNDGATSPPALAGHTKDPGDAGENGDAPNHSPPDRHRH